MEIDRKELKDGDIVYGCAFCIEVDRVDPSNKERTWEHTSLKCKPSKGIINDKKFYVLKRDGAPRKTGVYLDARHYANTYEESVEIYNALIREKQRHLQEIVNRLNDEIIETKKE